jgi:hypothetical protein
MIKEVWEKWDDEEANRMGYGANSIIFPKILNNGVMRFLARLEWR